MASEEDEDILLNMRAKLYRFDKEIDEWKERASGKLKLLKHRKTGQMRLVMLQSKTLEIRATHFVVPSISFQEHAINECSCVRYALDYADEEQKEEHFCIRFASADRKNLNLWL